MLMPSLPPVLKPWMMRPCAGQRNSGPPLEATFSSAGGRLAVGVGVGLRLARGDRRHLAGHLRLRFDLRLGDPAAARLLGLGRLACGLAVFEFGLLLRLLGALVLDLGLAELGLALRRGLAHADGRRALLPMHHVAVVVLGLRAGLVALGDLLVLRLAIRHRLGKPLAAMRTGRLGLGDVRTTGLVDRDHEAGAGADVRRGAEAVGVQQRVGRHVVAVGEHRGGLAVGGDDRHATLRAPGAMAARGGELGARRGVGVMRRRTRGFVAGDAARGRRGERMRDDRAARLVGRGCHVSVGHVLVGHARLQAAGRRRIGRGGLERIAERVAGEAARVRATGEKGRRHAGESETRDDAHTVRNCFTHDATCQTRGVGFAINDAAS